MDLVNAEEASTSGNEVEKGGEEAVDRVAKKAKVSGEFEAAGDFNVYMKRVAEIVIVLAGMGRMRGGRSPTDVERELMVEARRKLAFLCESLPPKELLSKDDYGALVEDLGLNRLNDQTGFTRPRPSIAEKLRLAMRKIEESREIAAKSLSYSGQIPHGGLFINGQSVTDANLKVTPDKLNSMAPSLTGFRPFTPMNQAKLVSASTNHGHSQTSEAVQTSLDSLTSNQSEAEPSRLALPVAAVKQLKSDACSDGMLHSVQSVTAISAGDQVLGAFPSSSSVQLSSVAQAKVSEGLRNTIYGSKVDQGIHKDVRFLSTSQLPDIKDSEMLQHTASSGPYSVHQTSQPVNSVGSLSTQASHNDIAKDVHKILQPGPHSHPEWSPPSIAYMNAPLTCQICKVTITDVGSLLVCDACEKGVHVKCLHAYNQKGIPQGEWNCPKCLISNNGKPLPLKYGRIGKIVNVSKPSNANKLQSSIENKIDTSDGKFNQQKLATDGCATETSKDMLVNHVLPVEGSTAEEITADTRMLDTGTSAPQLSSGPVETKEEEKQPTPQDDNIPQQQAGNPIVNDEELPAKSTRSEDPPLKQFDTSSLDGFELSNQARTDEVPHASASVGASASALLENGNIMQTGVNGSSNLQDSCEHNFFGVISQEGQDVSQPTGGTTENERKVVDCPKLSVERFPSVCWVGDQMQVVDGKTYYQGCCVNQAVYKLQDHAFFHSEDPNVAPYIAKLEVLWEDNTNGTKWALVSMCYYYSNLPEIVGRPSTFEENEVYKSNHQRNVLLHLIQGPCSVLSASKYRQEREIGIQTGSTASQNLGPILFCKWFYDEAKGLFQPFTEQ